MRPGLGPLVLAVARRLVVVGAIIAAVMALKALLIAPAQAQHHPDHSEPHWYDNECCNLRDCAPVADDRVEETPGGYVVILKGGEHPSFPDGAPERRYEIARGDPRIRKSKDFRFHPCIPPVSMHLLCIYVPPESG